MHAGRVLHARCIEIEQSMRHVCAPWFPWISRNFAWFRTPTSRNLAAKRSTGSFKRASRTSCAFSNANGARQLSFACVVHRSRTKFATNCVKFTCLKNYREILHNFERRHRAISPPNAAMTRRRATPTSSVLQNLHYACRPSFACAVHRNRTKFATRSRAFERNFAWFRTPTSRNLAAERSANSAKSCADVVRVLQRKRCTQAEFCMRSASKSNRICDKFARDSGEILHNFKRRHRAISPPSPAMIP